MNQSNYRPDIDGLRAVAVLSVLLYHYGAKWLPGGFTGVDVFFVISGFVITNKLRHEMDAGTFSILGFYEGRFRRILPALLLMLLVTFAAGSFLLVPGDFVSTASSAIYAAFGLGNLYFYWHTGYFDQSSELQPLLHTWSLGVEEQFYFAWPIVLFVGLKILRSRRLLAGVIAVGLIAIFIYAARKVGNDPKGAFYLPHPRAWELGLGALMTFVPRIERSALGTIISLSGIGLIAYSFISVTAGSDFPGVNALYSCIGAALLIWPHRGNAVASLLSFKPVVLIGLLSYSLYLWHWPVIVLYRHWANEAFPGLFATFALGFLSFGLAYLSWRYVERPFRRRGGGSPLTAVLAGLIAISVTSASAYVIVQRDGFPNRVPADQRAMAGLDVMWHWDCPRWVYPTASGRELGQQCNFGAPWDTAKTKVVLWGDSHAQHMAPLLEAAIGNKSVSVLLAYQCAAAVGDPYTFDYPEIPTYSADCRKWNDTVMLYLQQNPDIDLVMLAGFWSSIIGHLHTIDTEPGDTAAGLATLKQALAEVIDRSASPGRRIALVSDVPLFLGTRPALCNSAGGNIIQRMACPASSEGRTKREFWADQGPIVTAFRELAGLNVSVLETGPAMCEGNACLTTINGEFLYRDVHHLRRNLQPETRRQVARLFGFDELLDWAMKH